MCASVCPKSQLLRVFVFVFDSCTSTLLLVCVCVIGGSVVNYSERHRGSSFSAFVSEMVMVSLLEVSIFVCVVLLGCGKCQVVLCFVAYASGVCRKRVLALAGETFIRQEPWARRARRAVG